MVGGRVLRLGAFPGREGEGLGLFLEDGSAPRVARIVYLPGVDASAREGLEREVSRAADALHHPHVEPPLGLGDIDGRLAVAVEHADGETLAEILAVGGRLPPQVAARIVRDACVAIDFAHQEGQDGVPFLHGWLRPSLLLVCRSGVTLVSGFGVGLCRSAADLMPWQSPEQVLGGPRAASRASDVHGLGLVLHACLAGENPFEREPDPDVAILTRAAPVLEPLGVSSALAAVVRRALSVKAPERFAGPRELARAIEAAVPDLATPAAVAAWAESLFPAGMGMRVLRQRAVDAAVVAAARESNRRPEPEGRPVPLPEPYVEPKVAARAEPIPDPRRGRSPPPHLGFRPAPNPATGSSPAPRMAPAVQAVQAGTGPRTTARLHAAPPPADDGDDVLVGEFSLAAPPFPHPVKAANPVDAIEIDVVLSDPPPPLRLPVPPRPTAGGVQAIGRADVRTGAQQVAAGVAALAMANLRGWP
jgi:serine/threonine protein kinase